jgi:hypothetical protein
MFQRFVQVLEADDPDDAQREVLRRFWTRTATRPGLSAPSAHAHADPPADPPAHPPERPGAIVVDFARWASTRRVER